MLTEMQPMAMPALGAQEREFNRQFHALSAHYDRGAEFVNLREFSNQLEQLYKDHKAKLDGMMIEITWAQRFRRPLSVTTLTIVNALLYFEAHRFVAVHARKCTPGLDPDELADAVGATFIDVDRRLQLKPSLLTGGSDGSPQELSVFIWNTYADFCRTVNRISRNKMNDVLKQRKRKSRLRQAATGVLDAIACEDNPVWFDEPKSMPKKRTKKAPGRRKKNTDRPDKP